MHQYLLTLAPQMALTDRCCVELGQGLLIVGLRGDAGAVADQPALSFAGLLRQLRIEARLTQEELAEAARLSPRLISDLERGIIRTARKDTALFLADALGLTGSAREVFSAAARGRVPAAEVLMALSASRNNLPTPVDSFIGRRWSWPRSPRLSARIAW